MYYKLYHKNPIPTENLQLSLLLANHINSIHHTETHPKDRFTMTSNRFQKISPLPLDPLLSN